MGPNNGFKIVVFAIRLCNFLDICPQSVVEFIYDIFSSVVILETRLVNICIDLFDVTGTLRTLFFDSSLVL